MTKIKFDINIFPACELTESDVTGFKSSENLNGFLLNEPTDIALNDYNLNDGYFFNLIVYKKYKSNQVVVQSETPFKIETVDEIYENNFPSFQYKFTRDGHYEIMKTFIMDKQYYLTHKLNSVFMNRNICYSDGLFIYSYDPLTDTEIILNTTDYLQFLCEKPLATVIQSSQEFFTTCYLTKCYFYFMKEILDKRLACGACKIEDKTLEHKNLVFETLEIVNYLQHVGNYREAQRVLEAMDGCSGVCKSVLKNHNGCGC